MVKLKADGALVMAAHPGVMLRSEVRPTSKLGSKIEDVLAEEVRSGAYWSWSMRYQDSRPEGRQWR